MDLDWEQLGGALSPDALRALREHVGNTSVDAPASIFSSSAPLNVVYKDVNYWNDRFKDEESYDWLLSFDQTKDYVLPHIPSVQSRILIIGCVCCQYDSCW